MFIVAAACDAESSVGKPHKILRRKTRAARTCRSDGAWRIPRRSPINIALLTELYPIKIRELSMPGERRRRAMFIVAAACDAVSSVRSGM